MKRIPIYASDWIGGFGLPDFDSWKLLRWKVGDGEAVTGSTVIAELECSVAVMEHEVFYSGTLHHGIGEGDSFLISEPIGFIRCSEVEYEAYLESESARRICIAIEPGELREIEALKADESNEAFVARVFRAGLERLRSHR